VKAPKQAVLLPFGLKHSAHAASWASLLAILADFRAVWTVMLDCHLRARKIIPMQFFTLPGVIWSMGDKIS